MSHVKQDSTLRDEMWVLVDSFIKEQGLVRLHLDSYNRFIDFGLQQIIDEMGRIESSIPGCYIELGAIRVEEPSIKEAKGYTIRATPIDAKLRGFTYAAPIKLEMTLYIDNVPRSTRKDVVIGMMPIMVKSNRCVLSKMSREEQIRYGMDPDDPGGYFIINGAERVIVAQEDLAVNRILVDVAPSGSGATHIAKVFSSTPGQKVPVSLERRKNGALYVGFPALPVKIPFVIMMRALGMKTDAEIAEAVSTDVTIQNELGVSFEEAADIRTVEEAIDYIGSRLAHGKPAERRREFALTVIDKNFLVHLGTRPEDRKVKALYLGQMARRLLEVSLGMREIDDKDHYKNKRLKLAGDLLGILFRSIFRNFQRDVKYQLEKMLSRRRDMDIDVANLVRPNLITEKLEHYLATGNWVGGKTGVSQLLDRTNYLSTLSHLRRIVSPLSRSQPHYEARDLHPTQWGRICPVETPEGPNCGLVKNLSLLALVTKGEATNIMKQTIYELLDVKPLRKAPKEWAEVYLDDVLIGRHPKPEELVSQIRKLRRRVEISYEVNVALVDGPLGREVHINTDANRIIRPLIVVENGEPKLTKELLEKVRNGEITWSDLISMGVIEYLDAEEEENAYIAIWPEEVTKEHTHLEISPAALFGVVGSIIPFSDHNHSPRNTFEAAMGKQALGFAVANYSKRVDTRGHLLHYPQRPLVTTKAIESIGLSKRPFGQNMVVAVISYTGYNIQDAVIINKSAIDRGLGRSTFFRLYEAEEMRYPGGISDKIEIPQPNVKDYRVPESYSKLEPDGVITPEIEVRGGEVLIGRTSPPRFMEEYEQRGALGGPIRRDTSIALRHGEKGIVDAVIFTNTVDGNPLIRVRVRDLRIPELGDKFASRHGQKGVIGMLLSQEDMPFTEDGIVPDLIINPHAIPSRMTIGQLLESLAGKVAALKGNIEDGTPFQENVEERLRKELLALGFEPRGKEVMYNGLTGEKFEAEIFIGIVYYQKLHHMVSDKMHARARGPVQMLTHQPTEGRAKEGGLRLGEMERDCLIAHGAAATLKDRLMDMSDKTTIYVCRNCGSMGYYDWKKGEYVCPVCGPKADIVPVEISYAFKLLLQELMSMMVNPRLEVVEKYQKGV